LGFDWQPSMAASMALALSSTALVLQLLNEKNLMNTPVGETSFSILLFQDIAVIPILVLMPLLAMQGSSGVTLQEGAFRNSRVISGPLSMLRQSRR
jgi:Kef-type K+ transport system membrane component KefB